jgi:O-antigen/teichoic acid export membrane protein
MTNVTDKLIKGSIWISLSRALVNGLSTLSTFVLAWYLVPSDFGLVAIATTLQAILLAVTDLSLSQALIRHENPGSSHFDAVWTLGAVRGLVLAFIFSAAAFPMAAAYNEPRLVEVMLALSFGLLMSSLGNPRRIMLQRDLVFWQEFMLEVSQKVVGFAATVWIAVFYQSYWALVIGTLALQLTGLLVSYTSLPYLPRITFKHSRELFSFSVWLTAGQIVSTLNGRLENLLIGKVLGTAPLGVYNLGGTLAMLATREATVPLTRTIYPGFSSVRDDPERLRKAYQRAQALLTAIALPIGVGLAVVADPLVKLALGEKWLEAIYIIQALAAIFSLLTLGSLVQPLGMATGHTRLLFIRDLQMLFLRLPLIISGLYMWGLQGVVLARVFTGLITTVVNMGLVRKLIGVTISQQLLVNFRSIVSTIMMTVVVLILLKFLGSSSSRPVLAVHLGLAVVAGAVSYVGTNLVLWVVAKKPSGPEAEFARLLSKLSAVLKGRLRSKLV